MMLADEDANVVHLITTLACLHVTPPQRFGKKVTLGLVPISFSHGAWLWGRPYDPPYSVELWDDNGSHASVRCRSYGGLRREPRRAIFSVIRKAQAPCRFGK
jgi:hypothetical protein